MIGKGTAMTARRRGGGVQTTMRERAIIRAMRSPNKSGPSSPPPSSIRSTFPISPLCFSFTGNLWLQSLMVEEWNENLEGWKIVVYLSSLSLSLRLSLLPYLPFFILISQLVKSLCFVLLLTTHLTLSYHCSWIVPYLLQKNFLLPSSPNKESK